VVVRSKDQKEELERLREKLEKLLQELQKQRKQDSDRKEENSVAVNQKPASGAPAKVTINLPANAQLFINDVACPLTSSKRSFDTPSLPPNKKFFYTVRAEWVQGGQPVSQTQRLVVEAGQNVSATFANLTPATTSTDR
jgi:uncharacterized protein (TIGR03000 family)